MQAALALLVLGVLLNAVAFFGLRYLAARRAGVRGAGVALGMVQQPWAGVSFGARALFAFVGPAGCYLACVGLLMTGLMLSGTFVVDEVSMRVLVAANGPAATSGIQN